MLAYSKSSMHSTSNGSMTTIPPEPISESIHGHCVDACHIHQHSSLSARWCCGAWPRSILSKEIPVLCLSTWRCLLGSGERIRDILSSPSEMIAMPVCMTKQHCTRKLTSGLGLYISWEHSFILPLLQLRVAQFLLNCVLSCSS